MNVSSLTAQMLLASGVRAVYSYPGDPIIELLEQLRVAELDVVLPRRESSAAFMAAAAAAATGRLGVCLSTLGPGSTGLVQGVAAAHLDRVPVLALSGQVSAGQEQLLTHQVVDHPRLFSAVTKWSGRLEVQNAAAILRKAVRIATAERPGAVHLSCSGDVLKAPAGDVAPTPPPTAVRSTIQVLASEGDDPVARTREARRPVIVAGTGAVRSGASADLQALAATLGAPVVVGPMAKGIMPEDSPWFAGVVDMACPDVVWDLLRSADLVLAAGFDAVELIKPWSVPAPVVHIDATANVDQIYAAPIELLGDVATILRGLAAELAGAEPRWSEDEVAAHRRRLFDVYRSGRTAGRLNPTDVVDTARSATAADAVITTDVGSHKLLVGQGWTTHSPRSVLMPNGLSAMGYAIPAAIAAGLTLPDTPVLAFVGDGGFAMAATELRLAAARKLGIVVVVLADGSLNRIELKQAAIGYPSTATLIEESDVVGMAEAMSCHGERVDSAAALAKALEQATGLDAPLVIEARIDPAQYQRHFAG